MPDGAKRLKGAPLVSINTCTPRRAGRSILIPLQSGNFGTNGFSPGHYRCFTDCMLSLPEFLKLDCRLCIRATRVMESFARGSAGRHAVSVRAKEYPREEGEAI